MQILKDIQQHVRNFFGISSVEANAFIILLPLMIVLLLLFPFYHHFFPSNENDYTKDEQQFKNLIAELTKKQLKNTDKDQLQTGFLSSIDPNKAVFYDLLALGLDTVIAARIIKYRNSGGNFNHKEDLLKIYGLNEQKLLQIRKFISLPDKPSELNPQEDVVLANSKETKITHTSAPDNYSKAVKNEPLKVDINKADSITLQKIKGIGPVLSSRIVKYRDLLGGFIDTVQYKEVYGLKSDVLNQLYIQTFLEAKPEVVTINLNTADAKDLARHPYISWKIANAIVAFRKQHGNYKTIEQLSEIKLIDHKTLEKIVPYLSL